MYPQPGAPMAPPQKPETFMLSTEAQQSLPHDAQVALQQVDNCRLLGGLSASRVVLTFASEILPPVSPRRLASRPAYSPFLASHRRLCLLCPLVSLATVSDQGK